MFVRWLEKELRSGRQSGEPTCPHLERPTYTITPVLLERKKQVYRFGPSFRTCCLANPLARASFWFEVRARFSELEEGADDLDDELAEFLLQNRHLLELLLSERIRPPTERQMHRYVEWRKENGITRRRRRKKIPYRDLALLGLSWPVDAETVRKTLRSITLEYHPDRTGSEDSTPEFIRRKQALDRIQACMEKHGQC